MAAKASIWVYLKKMVDHNLNLMLTCLCLDAFKICWVYVTGWWPNLGPQGKQLQLQETPLSRQVVVLVFTSSCLETPPPAPATNNNNNNNSHQTCVHHPSPLFPLCLRFSKEVTLDIDDLAEEPLEPQWFYFYKAFGWIWFLFAGRFWRKVGTLLLLL